MTYMIVGGVDWYSQRKLPIHHVALELGRDEEVVCIDNFGGGRRLNRRHLGRLFKRLTTTLPRRVEGIERVVGPIQIPVGGHTALIGRVNALLLAAQLRRIAAPLQRPLVVWTRVATPAVVHALESIPYDLLVYQVVDDFPNSPVIDPDLRPRLSEATNMLAERADLIFVSAAGLAEKRPQFAAKTHHFPNGVNVDQFRPARQARRQTGGRPVLGFIGALGQWVDTDLIIGVAESRPDAIVRLIGPITAPGNFPSAKIPSNVHFVGEVNHSELPGHLAQFTVGLIPYRLTSFTKYTFPSKMAEYLAAGVPVVSTPLPELKRFESVITIAETAQEVADAVDRLSSSGGPPLEELDRVLEGMRWDTLVAEMRSLIQRSLSIECSRQ